MCPPTSFGRDPASGLPVVTLEVLSKHHIIYDYGYAGTSAAFGAPSPLSTLVCDVVPAFCIDATLGGTSEEQGVNMTS